MVGSQVGDYRVLELLGVGGMGEVYRGVHTRLGRVVALKVLSPAADVSASTERFHNEARIHAAIRHPHIATLFEFCDYNGRSCLIMEYVDGDLLSANLKSRGPLPSEQAAKVACDLARALSYLHEHDIVHRDIKASNVKIDTQGQAKLLDFGIARSASSPRLTQAGSIIGTLEYMAPEQLCGETATPQTDIWALGVLLYEMLTAKMPFATTDLPSLHHKITRVGYTKASTENPAVSAAFDQIIARCLQKSTAARYQRAEELAHDLEKLLPVQSESGTVRAEGSVSSPGKLLSCKPAALLAGGVAAFLLFAIGGALLFGGRNDISSAPSVGDTSESKVLPQTAQREKESLIPVESESTRDGDSREVKIDVTTGSAEIYQEDELLGTTPYNLEEPLGTDVRLTLKRPGYRDYDVRFTITERKRSYSFLMEKE